MEEAARSNSSRVLVTGNAACRIRVRALDSSRAVISASIRVRRNSSGSHRWVRAVTSSSGARRRIAASLSRRSPAVRSAASGGGAVLIAHRRRRLRRTCSRSAAGPAPTGSVSTSACPAARGVGAAPAAARIERTSSARQRRNSTARSSAATRAASPCAACRVRISPISRARLDTPAAAAPAKNAAAGSPRARNCFSAAVLGARRPAWLVRPAPTRSAHQRCWPHRARRAGARRRSRR